MLSRVTDFSCSPRGKWLVIVAWLIVTAVLVPVAPTLDDVTSNDQETFLPKGAESTRVARLVAERFPSAGTPAIVVFHNPNGLTDGDLAEAKRLNDWLLTESPENVDRQGLVSIFTVPQAAASLHSDDNRTMTMVVNITGESANEPYAETIDLMRETIGEDRGDLGVRVSGPGGLIDDLLKVFAQIDVFLLLVTAVLVLVLLIIIYRSPVVALVPLFAVGWVFSLAGAIGAIAAERFGLPINGQSRGVMTVLLFGAGTDYCLFIASRFREELRHTQDKHEAMRRAMHAVGEAIASSAGTVLVATLALLLAVLRSNQTLGPLLSVAVGTMLVAALTLVPAILTVLGRFSYWPFRPRFDPAAENASEVDAHGVWSRIANGVARRPATVLAATVAVFLLMALGVTRLVQDFDTISSLPADSDSREGFEFLRASFPAGELAPTDAYIELPTGTNALAALPQIDQVTQQMATVAGVVGVTSPSRPFGAGAPVGPDQIAGAAAALGRAGCDTLGTPNAANPALVEAVAVLGASCQDVSPDGGVVRLSITLDRNPYSLTAIDEIPALRETARQAVQDAGLATADEVTGANSRVLVGGETATAYDTKVANDRDIRVVLPIILVAIGIILALLLRSLVAPVYLLATIVLSYGAALGLSTLVFQEVLGHQGVGAGVPFFLFVFLVALGVDYNIFLMARVREETQRHGLKDGTRRALGRTGGVITSAGIILAGTFAALMTLPLRDLFQVGFSVAVGVLLDTFVVRSLVVPAAVAIIGDKVWWPSRLSRRSADPQPERELEPV